MRIDRITVGIRLFITSWIVSHVIANVNYSEIGGNSDETKIFVTEGKRLSRQKRYLIFPEGSNVQLVYCLTIGAHARVSELVVGLTAALAWELPSKIDERSKDLLHRQSRSVIYPKIEAFLQSIGIDGRSCVMRALCETGQRDSGKIGSGTFVQELFHAIFKLQRDGTSFELSDHREYDDAHEALGDCASLYPNCRYSVYDLNL